MREESQLDEMRDAIRGDFERLAARRGEQELMRVREPDLTGDPAEAEEQDQAEEPDQVEEQPDEPELESELTAPRRSWLGRLFST